MNEPVEQSERKEKYLTEESKRLAAWPFRLRVRRFSSVEQQDHGRT